MAAKAAPGAAVGARAAAEKFLGFVNATGSPYHSVQASVKLLREKGFVELKETSTWRSKLAPGGRFYVTRGGSDIFAFVVGGKFSPEKGGFCVVGGHTDSPCLRLRPVSKMSSAGFLQVGVQTYGGGLWHTWFDRGLGLAGKVVVKDKTSGELREVLVRVDRPVLLLPNLAIHLSTADERKAFQVNPETHLQPVLCTKGQDDQEFGGAEDAETKHHRALLKLIASQVPCEPSEILDADLCLMDALPGNLVGVYEEFISSPRIDNQLSTWAAVEGICQFADSPASAASTDICVAVAFDHEECGSSSACGADSNAMETWLGRVVDGLQVSSDLVAPMYQRSFLLSADCAHGLHPNYAAKHQSEHRPTFHGGIVFKTNANQRYATTCITSALMREVCEKAGVPVQEFVVRNDSPCGSTIGPMLSAQLGMRTIDIGSPQWAMHSCRESCATSDALHLLNVCRGFFEHFRSVDVAPAAS